MPAAIIGAPSASVVTEDRNSFFGLLTAIGTISIRDPDPGQQRFRLNVVDVGPTLGDLILLPNGTYIYLVSNQAIQFLGAGETRIDTFRVTAADGTTANVSFTIVGANDAAVIGNPTRFNVTEDLTVNALGQLTATGTISIRDADQNQSFFQTVVTPAAGVLGTLTLAADGSYSYAVSNAAVQFLAAGESRTDVFTIRAADGTSKNVSFVIAGRNDAAVIGDLPNTSVTEDGPTNAAGQLTATGVIAIADADQGEASFRTTVAAVGTTLGALVIAANGAYTYSVANAAVQFLNSGETRIDSFVLTALDGTTRTVSFTINGRNEGVVIGDPTVSTVVEDGPTTAGNLTASGTVAITTGASFSTVVTPAAGNLGSLTLAAGGAYTYSVANDAVQYLGAGQTRVESFTIRATDGTEKQVSFTIAGVNDPAVIGAPNVTSVTEDLNVSGGLLTAAGNITVSDVDQGQAGFQTTVTSGAGTLGALSLAANGAYTFSVANSAVQFLGAGQSKTESFTVSSIDGTTRVVDFTITGVNDAAVIGAPSVSGVTEDIGANAGGFLTAIGSISVNDPDQNESAFQTGVTAGAGALGALSLAANGAYTYSVANALVQSLGAGATRTDSFTVTSLDGTTAAVSFTITGANDVATITGATTGAVAEDGTLTAGGTLTVSDVDAGEAVFATPASLAGTYGGFTFDVTTGAWGYALVNTAANVQGLRGGESVTDTLTVNSSDGTDSETITVSIAGANDAATITGTATGAVAEDGTPTAGGTLTVADVDAGEAAFATPASLAGTYGDFTFNATTGAWAYALSNPAANVQALAAGQSVTDTLIVTSFDGTDSETITVSIAGANDAATITGTATGAVAEDGTLTAGGALSVADVDTGQAVFAMPASLAGTYGSFSFNATSGAWGYSLANAAANVQALRGGQTVTDTLTVASFDGTDSETISVSIAGANDAATIAGTATGAVAEDGTITAGGTLTVSDVDTGEAVFATPASLVGTYGGFTFNAATGAWGYTLANTAANVQALAGGQSVTDTLAVTTLDGTDSETITVSIAGANDGVTISPDGLTGTVVEDGAFAQLTATGNIVFSDIDLTDTHTVTVIGGPSVAYGALFLSGVIEDPATADGRVQWTYVLDNAAAQQLAQGQSIVEVYTIAVADGFGSSTASLTITIEGSNDLPGTPTYTSPFSTANIAVIAVPENTAGLIATFTATDIDLTDTLTFSLTSEPGFDSDDFTIDATTGAIRFSTPPNFEAPTDATSDNLYQLRVFATDSSGGARFTDLTVQVTNVAEGNQAPVAVPDGGFATTEETAVSINAAALLLNDSDPNGDAIQVVSVFTSDFLGGGTAMLDEGLIRYTPGINTAEGYNGTLGGRNSWSDQSGPGFFYTIRDTGGLESTAFVRVQVANVNDPVVAVDDRFARTGATTQTVAAATITGNDRNPDPNPVLTITAVVDQSGIEQTIAGGQVTFSFANGTRFTYTVQDEGGSTDTGTIDFNSTPFANSDPNVVVSEAQQQGDFGAGVPGSDYIFIPAATLIGNDIAGEFDTGQTLTLAAPSFAIFGDAIQQVLFNLNGFAGAYVFLKQGDFTGETTFNYRVFDNGVPSLTSNDAGVQLIVAAGNDTPIAVQDGSGTGTGGAVVTVVEDGTVVIDKSLFLANDYDEEGRDAGLPSDGLTIATASSPFGEVTITAAGDVSFSPNANYNSDSASFRPFITYQVRDGQGALSSPTQLYLDVTGVDDAVDAVNFVQTYGAGDTSVFVPLSSFIANTTAPDGMPRLLSVGGALGGGVALVDSDSDGIFEGATFAFDGSGPFSFTYEMADPDGDVDTATVTLEQTALEPFVLYFSGDNGGGPKLWAYDPADGFYVREEIGQGFGVDNPEMITAYAGQVVFEATGDVASGSGLFFYAGDPNQGAQLRVLGDISEILVVGESLFALEGNTLAVLETPTAEFMFYAIDTVEASAGLWNQDGTVYLVGRDVVGNEQVYRFEPETGPVAVTDLGGDEFFRLRSPVATENGAVFFAADFANLDVPDGQDSGLLVRVKDGTTSTFGQAGFEGDQNARSLIAVGNKVFFIGTDTEGQERLFVADDSGSFTFITDLTGERDGIFLDADNSLTTRKLVAFNGGVLASFDDGSGRSNLYFTDGSGPMTALDPSLFNADWVQVVDGDAFFVSFNNSVDFPGFDDDGKEAYVFDGTSTTQLTDHAPFDIQELRVQSRDRLFLISDTPSGDSSGGGGSFIFEYNPRQSGSNETVAIPEQARAKVFDALFDGGDEGLHFTLRSPNGLEDQYFFIDANTNVLQSLPAETFALGTNDDRGFVGGAPYRYLDPVFGPELSVFQGVVPGDAVDALPGNVGIAPFSIAQSFDGETLYTSGSKLNDDTSEFERFVYRIQGDTATPVTGLIGETTVDTFAFFYELSATSGGATVIKGTFDRRTFADLGFEYWYIDGDTNTATQIDANAGFFGRTGRAEVDGILFYEDQTSEPGTSNQLGRFDPATSQTSAITINLDGDADVRELVALDGGVYLRAITQGVGFDGDLELVRVEANGTFQVIELRLDVPGDFRSSAPRQITAVGGENGVLVAFGEDGPTEFGTPALFKVDWVPGLLDQPGQAVVSRLDLGQFEIASVPFLEGGTEVFNGKVYFFADGVNGDVGLYSYDPVANTVDEVLLGNGQSGASTFDYQMEVAAGRLWFTFDEGQGEGMELYSLDALEAISLPLTNFNTTALGYGPSNMAIVEPFSMGS